MADRKTLVLGDWLPYSTPGNRTVELGCSEEDIKVPEDEREFPFGQPIKGLIECYKVLLGYCMNESHREGGLGRCSIRPTDI